MFVFDTNVLLNLYRMSDDVRSSIFEILKKLKGNLFLPHQVAHEFFKHRELEISAQINTFEKLRQFLRRVPSDFKGQFTRHPCIPIAEFEEELQRCVDKLIARVTETQNSNQLNYVIHPDPILTELDLIFADCTGDRPTPEEDGELTKQIETRFLANLSPCYFPSGRPAENSHVGDGRVWFQIVRYAALKQQPVIFVTGDMKPNWWRSAKIGNDEKLVGPHFQLIRDIAAAANSSFLMYDQSEFLSRATTFLGVNSQQKAIEEIQQIQSEDKRAQLELDLLNVEQHRAILGDIGKQKIFVDHLRISDIDKQGVALEALGKHQLLNDVESNVSAAYKQAFFDADKQRAALEALGKHQLLRDVESNVSAAYKQAFFDVDKQRAALVAIGNHQLLPDVQKIIQQSEGPELSNKGDVEPLAPPME